jgi:hypothetical protein
MAELSESKRRRRGPGKPFPKGVSGNPGGQSKEKRAFLERLRIEDADEIYEALMGLVREGNAPAVLRAVEYIAGKPPDVLHVGGVDGKGLDVKMVVDALEGLAKSRGETP